MADWIKRQFVFNRYYWFAAGLWLLTATTISHRYWPDTHWAKFTWYLLRLTWIFLPPIALWVVLMGFAALAGNDDYSARKYGE